VRTKRHFPAAIVDAIRDSKILGIRAGAEPHRFIGIWAVVVEGRVFVRSWSIKARGWYRTFLEQPQGAIQIAGHEIAVRAVRTRSDRLKSAIDRAYLEKYNTPASLKYARDLGRGKSRATTTELVPVRSQVAKGWALEIVSDEGRSRYRHVAVCTRSGR
jgi:hypothetical protein